MSRISLWLLLILAFLIRIWAGFYSGAADSDAADYTSLAMQMIADNDFSFIIDLESGRQVFQLWMLILVTSMKIFGATNAVAIITTSIIGTASIFLFYRIMSLFFSGKESFLLAILFAFTANFIAISMNPLYDCFLQFLFLSGIYFQCRYRESKALSHLLLGGFLASLMTFVHFSGYIFVFLIWAFYPVFTNDLPKRWKNWLMFSVVIGFLPIIQIFIWKIHFDSFVPYMDIAVHWQGNEKAAEITGLSLLKPATKVVLGLTPPFWVALLYYIFSGPPERKLRLYFMLPLMGILTLRFLLVDHQFLYKIFLLGMMLYLILMKREVGKENPGLYYFGGLGTVAILSVLVLFPIIPRLSGYVYGMTFLLPVLWMVAGKVLPKTNMRFGVLLGIHLVPLLLALGLNTTDLKHIKAGGSEYLFANIMVPWLPYYTKDERYKPLVNYLQENGVNSESYLLAVAPTRYIPCNLNMPQNHYRMLIPTEYVYGQGFVPNTFSKVRKWIEKNNPQYIVIDHEAVKKFEEQGKPVGLYEELETYCSTHFSEVKRLNEHQVIYAAKNQ